MAGVLSRHCEVLRGVEESFAQLCTDFRGARAQHEEPWISGPKDLVRICWVHPFWHHPLRRCSVTYSTCLRPTALSLLANVCKS